MGNNPQSLNGHYPSLTSSEEPMAGLDTNVTRWLLTFLTREELQKLSLGELRLLIALQYEDPSQLIGDASHSQPN